MPFGAEKKTESYYLVNKKVFDTVMVAGQKRVVKASFEEWYARQDWYRKVDGEPPGAKLHSNMYSVADLQKNAESVPGQRAGTDSQREVPDDDL